MVREIDNATYKTETEHPQSADGMEKHTNTEHAHVYDTDDQIVNEISNSKSLDQAAGTCVCEDPLAGGHLAALGVRVHNPQSGDRDDHALNERDNMDVPVQLGPRFEGVVRLREEDRREPRRDDCMDDGIEYEGAYDLMDVLGKRWAVQVHGVWFYEAS